MRIVKWNLSSRARQLSGGDAIIVSIPKSGRTWVRTFLCAYFCEKVGEAFTLQPESYGHGIPKVIYTHDLFEQRTKADWWDQLRGKYLIPYYERRRCPIILLARDPRDAFVSLYVQLTRRTRETPVNIKIKSVTELLRDRAFGIVSMIEVMNSWLAEWAARPGFLLLRYEDLREDPARFRLLLVSLGEIEVNQTAFRFAQQFAAFGNMQKLESTGAFDSKILRAGDTADPESFKVRRGKVGGFADYLSPNDQSFAADALAQLDPRFGYSPTKKNAIPRTT